MLANFFIWCAGSDTNVLSSCEDSVRTKHIGMGTLVLIPAILGFISMTYALSTIGKISDYPVLFILGGLTWGLIIFSFDRYIVSTHRKQQTNLSEFLNVSFYLRLLFALVLGVVVSHPFVLLYFDDSIKTRILNDRDQQIQEIESTYEESYNQLTSRCDSLIKSKRCYQALLTAEQSGKAVCLPCGNSSGIPNINGSFPRTMEIKGIIEDINAEIKRENTRVEARNKEKQQIKGSAEKTIYENTSFDYLTREITLEELKNESKIVAISEWFIILAFILVDILPLIFKTFSPFSMYDKILFDDTHLLTEIDISSRKATLQKAYNKISIQYVVNKDLDTANKGGGFAALTRKYNMSRNILFGLTIGIIAVAVAFLVGDIYRIDNNTVFWVTAIGSTLWSIIANLLTESIKGTSITDKIDP